MTEIFPTSRCVREFYAQFLDKNCLLPKAMGIAEFESKVIIVPNLSLADEDTRVLLMQEASAFENFKELKIDREFLSFIKNSSYLFRFFEELSLEEVHIDELEFADTYAEFSEHLSILKELLQRYKNLLIENKLYDKISLPSKYELNEEFLRSSDGYIFHLEGFLNRFEWNLFLEISKITTFKIALHVNKYNQKLIEQFTQIGIELSLNNTYIINLSSKKIEQTLKIVNQKIDYDIRGFSSRVLQASFVYEKITQFVREGIKPENIAVIVPDENYVTTLKSFDSYKNLNFAMGVSFTKNILYQKLNAIDKHIRLKDIEHKYRVVRLGIEKIDIEKFQQLWRKKLEWTEIVACLRTFCEEDKFDEIYEQELFRFTHLLKKLGKIELQKAMKLFLNRLASCSKDDVMGGKITVMGLLESRGVRFDGVIVVDFSDEFVPKRSNKDMFLSSSLRAHAKLPSKSDRENLQRYFYSSLFENAKKVAISFTKNDQSMSSRFLDELGLNAKVSPDEISYFKPLFDTYKLSPKYNPEIIEGSYSLKDAILSASKFKTILTCKRKFYYQYILKSKEAKVPDSSINQADIGNLLHEALHHVLKDTKVVDENILMIDLRRYLQSENRGLIWHYYLDIWLEYLGEFTKLEAKRYADGYRIYELEKSYNTSYKGFNLEGKIDRIDIKDNRLSVIDYKSGKIPTVTSRTIDKAVDFQLEFYYLLARKNKEVEALYYYDLKKAELVRESFFEEKMEKFDSILEELEKPITKFEKCESTTPCQFCPYTKLCNRQI